MIANLFWAEAYRQVLCLMAPQAEVNHRISIEYPLSFEPCALIHPHVGFFLAPHPIAKSRQRQIYVKFHLKVFIAIALAFLEFSAAVGVSVLHVTLSRLPSVTQS